MSSGRSRFWRYAATLVAAAGVIVAILIFVGQRQIMGTRLAISSKEAVHYSGTATEHEARLLGGKLVELEYFDGAAPCDVLFSKGDDGATVSFIVKPGYWDRPEVLKSFYGLGEQLAPAVGGKPFVVILRDASLNARAEIHID